jgi:hypothetical protein
MIRVVKISLIPLLLICLADMPYGYYQFIRYITSFSFVYFAFKENQDNHSQKIILYIFLTLLFQPFIKIPLGRQIWNVVDLLVALFLIINIYYDYKKDEFQDQKFKKEN